MKILIGLAILFVCIQANASDESSQYLDVLTKKTIEDFKKGLEIYNKTKSKGLPPIKKAGGQKYRFRAKNSEVSFSIVNYLNQQITIDDKLYDLDTLGNKKTSFLPTLISSAYANEDELDGETTKMILTALGSLSDKLESIGMLCFSGCQKEVRMKNLKKIFATLDSQKQDCDEQKNAQEDSLKKFPSLKIVSYLHSTLNPEFLMVKRFMQKISETSVKSVNTFMKDKLGIEKKYESCIGVMTAGTIADDSNDLAKGILVIRTRGQAAEVIEKTVSEATHICLKIDQLKSCLVDLKRNVASINTLKRNHKAAGETPKTEELPNLKSIER